MSDANRIAELEQQLAEAHQAIQALMNGEIDAVAQDAGTSPTLVREAQDALRHSEQLLRAVFDNAADAKLIADDAGRYVRVNAAACRLFGVPEHELLGRRISDFAAPGYQTAATWEAFVTAGHMAGELALLRPDGQRRELEFTAVANVLPGRHLSVLRDVTDRKATERELRETTRRLRTVIANAPIILYAVDTEGRYTLHEGKGLELIGLQPGQLVGHSVVERMGDTPAAVGAIRRALAGETLTGEYEAGGRVFESILLPLRDERGTIAGVTGVAFDVTARNTAEMARRRDEARYRGMIENGADGICLIQRDGKITYASSAAARILGYRVDALVGMNAFELFREEDRPTIIEQTLELVADPTRTTLHEFSICRGDGSMCWVESMGTNLLEDPAVSALVANFRDISDKKRAQEELRASDLRYRRIVENTSEGVWLYDANGKTIFVNQRMASMLGVTVDEMIGAPIFAFMDEAGQAAARQRMARRAQGISERGEFRLLRRDGSELWVALHADALLDESGRFESALALLTDITERRQRDELRGRLASIVALSDDAIISHGIEGTIRTWNRAAERLTQYSAEEAIGQSISMLYGSAHHVELEQRDQELTLIRKDGSPVEVSLTSSLLRHEDGDVIGASVIARDVSDRKRAELALRRTEEQLRQAQKMEAIGSLAGGVAHDFNNLLTVILSYTDMILDDLPAGDPMRVDLGEIRAAGQRATHLTRQLLAFSRKQILEPTVLDVNQVVAGVQNMLRRLVGEDVTLSVLSAPRAAKVHADPGQLEQVIMNLVVNARDAMPHGGNLTLEIANVTLDDEYAALHSNVTAGPYVMLAVTDTGVGMDHAIQARIFEPFFTTKDKSKGTGLGLSTVYGIIQQSGGHIWLYSEPGEGTTFKVYLPHTDRAAEPHAPQVEEQSHPHGVETILLVEDDRAVRATIRSILRKGGYNVIEAENAGEAFLISEEFRGNIHMLLTDVVMPRMSGKQLAERLVQKRRDLKVLFVSGYTENTIVHHGVLDAGIEFLTKPVTPDALLRKVRQVLDGRPRRATRSPPQS